MTTSRKIYCYHPSFSDDSWLGGANYFNNLRNVAGRFYPEIRMEPVGFFGLQMRFTALPDKIRHFYYRKSGKQLPDSFAAKGRGNYLRGLAGGNPVCAYTMSPRHLPVLEGIPWIYWIPDFQVYYLPELFTPDDVAFRKSGYVSGAGAAKVVVLSSETARADFNRFCPGNEAKAEVMRFVVEVPGEVYSVDPSYLLKKYGLPEKFVYVPNQFWTHKNHALVLEAMILLKQKGIPVNVVFSGSTNDPRNAGHFAGLLDLIRENGLDGRVFMLGVIPKEDVLQLIRQSCFLINASRFEGWSTTVEESKSIGKKMLLSDLPVHIEQAPPGAEYFPVDNAEALASLIGTNWDTKKPGPDREMEAQARDRIGERLEQFAAAFRNIIDKAISDQHSLK